MHTAGAPPPHPRPSSESGQDQLAPQVVPSSPGHRNGYTTAAGAASSFG
jgi:hypothetical protein